jgi:hypothetical protein
MIISEQKPLEEILRSLEGYDRVFLIGCGECATACNAGGEPELSQMKARLEEKGKFITGTCIPKSPCTASQVKTELAKNTQALKESQAILVLACGLGVQSVKDNDRTGLKVSPACNTICGALMDAKGDFYEKCSMCAECVLDSSAGICPITLCAKGLLNGPCGGMDKGKCEVDKEKDCAWVLIYKEMEKRGRLSGFREIRQARNFKKSNKPHKLIMAK